MPRVSVATLVTDRLDVVPVGIADECAEVILVVFREDPRGMEDLGTYRRRGASNVIGFRCAQEVT